METRRKHENGKQPSTIPEESLRNMVDTLIIEMNLVGKANTETKTTIPLSAFHISMKLLPQQMRAYLDKEGIDLAGFYEQISRVTTKATLIEIESRDERLVISVA